MIKDFIKIKLEKVIKDFFVKQKFKQIKEKLYKYIITNKYICIFFNILTLLFCILFLALKGKYAVVSCDDISDYFGAHIHLNHMRLPFVYFNYFLIKVLPNMLGIHIQDFAFYSETLTKCLFFTILTYVICMPFSIYITKFKIFNNFFYCFLYNLTIIMTYFTILSIICREKYWGAIFKFLSWFNDYITPLIFFSILFYYIANIYIGNKDLNKFDYIKLSILTLLTSLGNEIILFCIVIILSFLLLENYLKRKNKENKHTKVYLYLSSICIICGLIIICAPCTSALYNHHNISLYIPTISDLKIYLYLFVKKLFIDNIYFWITTIIGSIVLFLKKDKILKLSLYAFVAMFLFCITTIFVSKTGMYLENTEEAKLIQSWFLCPTLQMTYSIYLLMLSIFITGSSIKIIKNKYNKITLLLIFIICNVFFIINNYEKHEEIGWEKSVRRSMYIIDKISIYNIKNKKPIAIFNDEKNKNHMYGIYVPTDRIDEHNMNIYKGYFLKTYNMKTNEIIFLPFSDYFDNYINDGNSLTKEEIEELKFSNIKNINVGNSLTKEELEELKFRI